MSNGVFDSSEVSRRGLLKGAAVGAGVLASGGALSVLLEACGGGSGGGGATAGLPKGPEGTTKVPTKPYNPNLPVGEKPSGLPSRIGLIESAANETQDMFSEGVNAGGKKFGLDVTTANADGKAVEAVNATNTMLAQGIGGLFDQTLDPSQEASKLQAIKSGIVVFDLEPPMTTMVTTDQYATGEALGKAAAAYITEKLGGKAEVLMMNEGPVPALKPRYEGLRDAIEAAGPGVKIVADIPAQPVTQDSGFKITSTALQAHPGINVIVGVDELVVGALAALESADKASPTMFLGGIDGDKDALAKIEQGGPYKASVGYNFTQIGFTASQLTSEWLEGKSIAQVIRVEPTLLDSAAVIQKWKKDISSPTKIDSNYITLLGNISYEKRNLYIVKGS